eukprot:gene18229-23898_t
MALSTAGVPIKLLHEAEGHVVTIELKVGDIYRGLLIEAEDTMNCQLKEVTYTARNGRVSKLELVFIRGGQKIQALKSKAADAAFKTGSTKPTVPKVNRPAPLQKITGLSGIFSNSVIPTADNDDNTWSLIYVIGLGSSGFIVSTYYPELYSYNEVTISTSVLLLSGFLGGFGTRLGNGCTSGHGLCGLPRLSPRSLVAVLSFMLTGAISAINRKYIVEFIDNIIYLPEFKGNSYSLLTTIASLTVISTLYNKKYNFSLKNFTNYLVTYASAFIFGIGLSIAGMCDSRKIINFLDFLNPNGWDPSLIGVLGAGIVKENLIINWKLIVGSALFGISWGISGICPGPGIVLAGSNSKLVEVFIPAMLSGMVIQDFIFNSKK